MKIENSKSIPSRLGAWLKEKVRKFFVGLKKNPQLVPIVALAAAFLQFSLNLTPISNSTAKIQGQNMGLYSFITMLLMMLSFVCMLNAFPKRKAPNLAMGALMRVIYTVVIWADYCYIECINYALNRPQNPFVITAETQYIAVAKETIETHMILVAITLFCIIFEPIFAALFKKINTSVELESGKAIEAIDISEED